jgi:hypothetical protein
MSSFSFKFEQSNKLQMTLMEKLMGNKENLLSIFDLKVGLNLRYERLSSK